MSGLSFFENTDSLGARVHTRKRLATRSEASSAKRAWNLNPSRVIGRSSSSTSDSSASTATCSDSRNSNTCEKPVQGMTPTLQIVIGIVIPVTVALIVLVLMHRRSVRRQTQEDLRDHHKSLDFGLGDGGSGKSKRKSKMGLGGDEKSKRSRGLSLDMNLSSPYLLPDHVQGSRESMTSLAKTLHQNDDPYRPVATFISETGSIRSFEKTGRYTPSMITSSTKRMSRQSYAHPMSPGFPQPGPPRQNSFPKSPLTPSASSSITAVESVASDIPPPPPPAPAPAKQPTVPEHGPMPRYDGYPQIQEPAPVAQRDAPEPMRQEAHQDPKMPGFLNHESNESINEVGMRNASAGSGIGLGLLDGPQAAKQATHVSEVTNQQVNVGPARQSVIAVIEDTIDYVDYADYGAGEDDSRGRSRVRESGLVVPVQDNKRLSVGFRPLPPDEIIESEDPETRANRIRSFYKEYFDDSKQDPNKQSQYAGAAGQYGDGAYFDPDSNQFIMPYAQPVARRAMTPPPSGSRFPGPRGPGPRGPGPMGPSGPGQRGPPRGHSGSIGGMPRAGSAMSFGPRPGSSASAHMGPRSGSAMSARPKKNLPPPASLNTLPTPSKLKDDHFALINAADFAPPESFADRVGGRSQSPLGERRAYAPKVPAVNPLVSAFEEMAALPSPHLLRKSSTFTGLDFAPPKKFKDADTTSDAGSIRSNRSGMSNAARFAVGTGAGRVSRLPGDIIFSQASAVDSLKPTWNMHNN